MWRKLAPVMLLAGCGRLSFDGVAGDAGTQPGDGARDTSDGENAVCHVNWRKTAVHTELQLSASTEDPSLSADGRTIVFTSTAAGGLGSKDIYIATRATTGIPFGAPVNLTAVNSPSEEASPELSADGATLYFASNRGTSTDIWMSTKVANTWTTPTPVTELSTPNGSELELGVRSDGLATVVNRDAHMILFARSSTSAAFSGGVERPELAITGDVASPSLTSQAVYFHAGAVRDLYVACRNPDDSFGTPVPIAGLNTTNRDADPFVLEGDAVMYYQCQQDICEAAAMP